MVKIPEWWIETNTTEYCESVRDGTHDSPKQSEEWKFLVTSKNIKNSILDLSSCYKISKEDFDYINLRSKVDQRDILISMIWTVWEICLLKEQPDFAIKNVWLFKCWDEIKAKYLYYYLKSPLANQYIQSRLSWTTQKYIALWDLRQFPLIVPSKPQELQAIVSLLSSFDDKIELLRAENQTLEEMGQTLFKERFGKYKVWDELPDGWKWWELWEIWDQITERVKNEKERVVLSAVNSWNLVLSESYFSKQVFSEDIAKYIICNKWDFAYNPARINIGSIWRNFCWNWAVSPVYVVFRPKEKFWKYLEYIFKSERFKNHVEKYANWSVRQALNYDWFSRFELLITNNDILEKFNENLETFEKKIEENKKQIETLSNTRDQLLPKLMSWEVRVEF